MKYCLMGFHEKEDPNAEYCNSCKQEHADFIKRKQDVQNSPWDRYLSMLKSEAESPKSL